MECPICNKSFASERAYTGHKSVHRVGGRYSKSRKRTEHLEQHACTYCGVVKKHMFSSSNKFCNNKCQQDWNWLHITRPRFQSDDLMGNNAPTLRRLLVDRDGPGCSNCALEQWQGQPIVLDVDHIDGDRTNTRNSNLRLLCPNCHRQTETWGNVGHLRCKRKTQYTGL